MQNSKYELLSTPSSEADVTLPYVCVSVYIHTSDSGALNKKLIAVGEASMYILLRVSLYLQGPCQLVKSVV